MDAILPLKSLQIIGLHGYDGHIHDAELSVRCQGADAAYALTERVFREISRKFAYPLVKVMGGTPTFPMYAKRKDCECSPGTFVFWGLGVWKRLSGYAVQGSCLIDNSGHFRAG